MKVSRAAERCDTWRTDPGRSSGSPNRCSLVIADEHGEQLTARAYSLRLEAPRYVMRAIR